MRIVIMTVLLAAGAAGVAWAEWEPDLRLTSDPANSYVYVSNARRVGATESRVYAVWQDDRDGNWEVYYKVRNLAGWGPDNRLSTNDSASRYPAVAADSDYVYVVWQDRLNGDDEVFYMRSTDRGANWTGSRLTGDDSFPSMHVAVAAWGPVVHVAWEDLRNGAPELYYARSTDAGTTWGRTRLTSDDNFMSQFPALAISGSHVHVVWHDNRDGNWEIYYMRSLDFGSHWGPEMRLTWDSAGSNHPSIAAADSVLHVVWKDARYGSGHNYYKRSLNAGASWSSDQRLTDAPARPYFPSVQAAGTHVHAVWHDLRHGAGEVYYLRSVDSGASWEPELRLTDQPDSSTCPSIALSGSIVHVLWYDTRDGNPEIYYKRNPTGNALEESGQLAYSSSPCPATIVRGVLRLQGLGQNGDRPCCGGTVPALLLDVTGRKVMDLLPGANDIRHVAPGVYFAKQKGPRGQGSEGSSVRKIVIQH